MPRPSRQLDQSLLQSGCLLYPVLGCAGMTVRRVAEHAGVTPAMFHYHFQSKDRFLRALLQQQYEEFYAVLSAPLAEPGPALECLRAALGRVARFLRDHRPVVSRIVLDVAAGEAVARDFLRENAPRHLGLLVALLARAEAEGSLQPLPALQRFTFLLGAVVAPVLVVGSLSDVGIAADWVVAQAQPQVLDDAAIDQRIDLALRALQAQAPAGLNRSSP